MILVVAGIIENERGEILLAQRPEGKHLAGLWEFPGGKVEKGESFEEALHRELKEELQLDIRIVKHLGAFSYNYSWGAIELQVFRVKMLSAPLTTEHVQSFKWLKAEQIDLKTLAPADIEPLKFYLEMPII